MFLSGRLILGEGLHTVRWGRGRGWEKRAAYFQMGNESCCQSHAGGGGSHVVKSIFSFSNSGQFPPKRLYAFWFNFSHIAIWYFPLFSLVIIYSVLPHIRTKENTKTYNW